VRAYSDRPPSSYLAMVEVALCMALFVACVLHIRLRQRHARLNATPVSMNSLASPSASAP